MSQYLRDETLKNLTLREESIKEINEELLKIRNKENEIIRNDINNIKFMQLSYIIRFDKKGFWIYEFDKIMDYFRSAKDIERFIFVLKSEEHEKSYKNKGKGVEIRLDSRDPKNCFIAVQNDDQGWVDSTFLVLKEKIDNFANRNYLARNVIIPFVIQMLGVISGLLLSLWAAINFSAKLNITYSFGFAFIIAFLLFSNIWTYLYIACLKMVDFFWPNISFKEKSGIYNTIKTLISGIFITYCLIIIGWLGKSLWGFVLSMFISKKI